MVISTKQVKPKDKELYAYNPSNRFRIYERNISGAIFYKFFPDVFKDKIIQTMKGLKIPLKIEENDTGWIKINVPKEHQENPAVKEMISNLQSDDVDDYYEKKSKFYAAKGWQCVVRDI